jgi:hypothetical protein
MTASAPALRKVHLTIAGSDLGWLMRILQATQTAFSVTAVQASRPVLTLTFSKLGECQAAVVELHAESSAADVRDLLDRSPGVRFVFVADTMPLRHAVARVIREGGHAVISRADPPFVIAATLAALMAVGDSST